MVTIKRVFRPDRSRGAVTSIVAHNDGGICVVDVTMRYRPGMRRVTTLAAALILGAWCIAWTFLSNLSN